MTSPSVGAGGMTSLQALVTGVLAGALLKAGGDFLTIDVEIEMDDDGNYLPEIYVTGKESGEKLMVSVEVWDE